MKDKILTFIIGVLVGAIITTSGFLVYEKLNTNKSDMPNGERPQMMEKQNGETPPEKPDGDQGQMGGTPPEMPSNTNSNSNSNSNT